MKNITIIIYILLSTLYNTSLYPRQLNIKQDINKSKIDSSVGIDKSNDSLINKESNILKPKEKDLVVVSKTPEFFTYTLTTISILLSCFTLLVGVITGIGLFIVKRVDSERKSLENIRKTFETEQGKAQEKMKEDYLKMIEAFKKTAFRYTKLNIAKRQLKDLLSIESSSIKDVYSSIQKTINYPDLECLRLYAQALMRYENNIDIIRLIRNGLLQYSQYPEDIN